MKRTLRSKPKKLQISMQKNLYDKDFYKWSNSQVTLLKKKEFSKLDLENIIEEIESLAKRDMRSLKSQLPRLLHHLLKLKYTPDRKGNSKSWDGSIYTSRKHIKLILSDSPSLKTKLKKMCSDAYKEALEMAIADSDYEEHLFPKECPWTLKEILDE